MSASTVTAPAPQAGEAAELVASLHDRMTHVIDSEVARLIRRVSFTPATHTELATALNRIADALLGPVCARVSAHAGTPDADRYVTAARELFALTPGRPDTGWTA